MNRKDIENANIAPIEPGWENHNFIYQLFKTNLQAYGIYGGDSGSPTYGISAKM